MSEYHEQEPPEHNLYKFAQLAYYLAKEGHYEAAWGVMAVGVDYYTGVRDVGALDLGGLDVALADGEVRVDV